MLRTYRIRPVPYKAIAPQPEYRARSNLSPDHRGHIVDLFSNFDRVRL